MAEVRPLAGKVAVVAGATRGAGRGIAEMLGQAGATVYCSGRSSSMGRSSIGPGTGRGSIGLIEEAASGAPAPDGPLKAFILSKRPETIEETALKVDARGGRGIPVRVDHTVEAEVASLFDRVRSEQGRLDILVNDVWGGDELAEWGKPFWELSMEKGILMQQRAVLSHILTARYGAPLLIAGRGGLLVEITDGDSPTYRGNLFYDLAKSSAIRLAMAMGSEFTLPGDWPRCMAFPMRTARSPIGAGISRSMWPGGNLFSDWRWTMAYRENDNIVLASIYMVLITLVLFFLPLLNGVIGGAVGGYKAGTPMRGIMAALIPSVVIGGALWIIFAKFGGPVLGFFAGAAAGLLVILADIGIFLGALIGGYFAESRGPKRLAPA